MRWVLRATGAVRWCSLGAAIPLALMAAPGVGAAAVSSPLIAGAVPVPFIAAWPAAFVALTVHGARGLSDNGHMNRRWLAISGFLVLSFVLPLVATAAAARFGRHPVSWVLLRSLAVDVAVATVVIGHVPRRAWDSTVAVVCGSTFVAVVTLGSAAGRVRWWAYPIDSTSTATASDLTVAAVVVAASCATAWRWARGGSLR